MKPLIIAFGLSFLAWNSHAMALDGGHIHDYELAVPATFALSLSKADSFQGQAAAYGPESLTLTSTNIVKFFGLPQEARCYWVFDFESDSSLLAGALVIASKESGEIYEEFAYGFGVTLFELIDGGDPGAESVGVISRDQGSISIIVNMAMTWNISKDVSPVATFGRFALRIEEGEKKTTVSFSSLSDLAGDGLEDKGLMVTRGRLEANGEVHQVTP